MRTLKFRAWNIVQKRWEKKLCLYFDDGKIGDCSECFHNEEDSSSYVVQQSTGVLNDYYQEIYEGDIVTFSVDHGEPRGVIEYAATITWLRTGFIAILHKEMTMNNSLIQDKVNINRDMFVVGNIFENPELIVEL